MGYQKGKSAEVELIICEISFKLHARISFRQAFGGPDAETGAGELVSRAGGRKWRSEFLKVQGTTASL